VFTSARCFEANLPLVQDFIPKLKQHLLRRVLSILNLQHQSQTSDCGPNSFLFKHDRMYQHNLLRINFTSYDVRRSQDAVNAHILHCNIMVLNRDGDDDDNTSDHLFRYAWVLGTYHVNVVYVA
jgi:hypothetical protein